MKYKTLFRLLVRFLGVGFLAFGCQGLLYAAFSVLWNWYKPSSFRPDSWWTWTVVPPMAHVLIGIYLFFGGRWIVNLAIPSNRPYCPNCAYELTGISNGRCPECGTPFRAEDVQPPMA